MRAGQDGREALNMLLEMSKNGPIKDQIALVISDIRDAGDGRLHLHRRDPQQSRPQDLHVILHFLSGVFNQAMVQKVGANNFI